MKVLLENIELEVVGKWVGKYYPATQETPEEYPDYEIESICVYDSNVDIIDLLSIEQLELINEQIDYNEHY